MATYISLFSFTDQGIRNVQQSTERAQAFRKLAQKAGVTVKDIYWTLGAYDGVAIADAPDAQTMQSALLSLGSRGNIRTQTLPGFSSEEMDSILAKLR